MWYKFEFRPYQRKFVRGVATSHGMWNIREGIILRLSDENGRITWGEIAPISWFGSETLQQALNFCRQLREEITEETIFSIPDELPACQFGFESALEMGSRELGIGQGASGIGQGARGMGHWAWGKGQGARGKGKISTSMPNSQCPIPNSQFPISLAYSGLLPAGEAALQVWQKLWQEGYSTLKWKIGVYPTPVELEILELLIQNLPASAKLRLDANGGLKFEEAKLWLLTCDRINANDELPVEIEYLEQPLPVDQFAAMLELSNRYKTAIALDESVATLKQLQYCFKQGWRGIFVIKPGIAGFPSRLRQFCQQYKIDAVFSSVFETAIGRLAALQLAAELSKQKKAIGFGINHWFAEDDVIWLKNLW